MEGVLEESVAETDTKWIAERLPKTSMEIEEDVDSEGQPSMESKNEKAGHGAQMSSLDQLLAASALEQSKRKSGKIESVLKHP
jgi:hypothetical protein